MIVIKNINNTRCMFNASSINIGSDTINQIGKNKY